MKMLRGFLSLVLILVTTLLVSCSSPTEAKIPTIYTPEKIANLQLYVKPVTTAREKMDTLKGFIDSENWIDTRTFIHGPLGELRQDLSIISGKLLPKDQDTARNTAKELFLHFDRLDAAAKDRSSGVAQAQYIEAVKDFDAFLNLIPKS